MRNVLAPARCARPAVLLLGLALAAHAIQFAPAGNLSAQWTFDTVSGTSTPDLSGNNNTATLVNGATTAPGLAQSGVQLNGTSQYLTAAHAASLDVGLGDFSVSAWVRPTGTTPMRVLNKWDGTKGWLVDINATTGGAAQPGFLRARMTDGTTNVDYSFSGPIAAGVWQHIALTVDRAADQLKLFVNGTQIGTTQSITALAGSLSNTALVGIGTIPSSAGSYFNGVVDEVILYKRVLNATELGDLSTTPPPAPGTLTRTNGINRVTLNWLASAGAASYQVLRSGTSGGPYPDPYVPVATGLTALTYTDTTAGFPNTYYYVVIAVDGATPSAYSNQVVGTPLPPEVTASPASGLQTNENGATTTFNVTFNQPAPAGGSLVTVSSNDTTEGSVSTSFAGALTTATGFQLTVPAGSSPTIPVTVTGQPDNFIDGNIAYTIGVTASGFVSLTIPPVQCTNNDTDTPGVTFSKTIGLQTTEAGGVDTLTVTLNTQPFGVITMSLASSNPAEGTVSPSSITFTSSNWNTPQQVTLTGVDDPAIDFAVGYTIVTGALVTNVAGDAAYSGFQPVDLLAVNQDDEVIPEPTHAWGNGGGCGLTGLDAVLLLALAGFWRRRRAR
jgi:hypothetical protein